MSEPVPCKYCDRYIRKLDVEHVACDDCSKERGIPIFVEDKGKVKKKDDVKPKKKTKWIQRGLITGSHKVKTPRFIDFYLSTVIPSDTKYKEYKDKFGYISLGRNCFESLKNDTKVTLSTQAHMVAAKGFLSIRGLDILLAIIDEAVRQDSKVINMTAVDFRNKLGLSDSTIHYDLLFSQLEKIANIGLIFSNDIDIEKKLKRTLGRSMEMYKLIDLISDEKIIPGKTNKRQYTYTITLSDEFFKAISKSYGLIDLRVYNSMKLPTAKMLYVLARATDFKMVPFQRKRAEVTQKLNITNDRNALNKLKKAAEELEKRTFKTIKVNVSKKYVQFVYK